MTMVEISAQDAGGLYGPAMGACNERQRRFVLALLDLGGRDATEAARRAGYSPGAASDNKGGLHVQAHRLMHDPRVLEAIREESIARMRSDGLALTHDLLEIAHDKDVDVKVRLKAIGMGLDRIGLHGISEQRTVVDDRRGRPELLAELLELLKAARALAGPLIDVTPEKEAGDG